MSHPNPDLYRGGDFACVIVQSAVPTVHLRWRLPQPGNDRGVLPTLEQAWHLSDGAIEWRPVSVIAWDAP